MDDCFEKICKTLSADGFRARNIIALVEVESKDKIRGTSHQSGKQRMWYMQGVMLGSNAAPV